jgi:hypothetical protein
MLPLIFGAITLVAPAFGAFFQWENLKESRLRDQRQIEEKRNVEQMVQTEVKNQIAISLKTFNKPNVAQSVTYPNPDPVPKVAEEPRPPAKDRNKPRSLTRQRGSMTKPPTADRDPQGFGSSMPPAADKPQLPSLRTWIPEQRPSLIPIIEDTSPIFRSVL